ncbi:MAG: cupin domain-containing protein [Candidatus Verstraetearchaeota archaeon]|nr:cupin domain-containing protein [Candidatus Verstraetearchaeota archaeon]
MIIVKKDEAPVFPAPPPSKKVTKILIDPVVGSKHLAMGFTVYPVGEKGAPHAHTGEETIFILRGKAKISGVKGEYILEAGDLVYIPPNETHTLENFGDEELQFIWVYTPPGDEKAIRERAKKH